MTSKLRRESCDFAEYFKMFILHENSLKTKCAQNVFKIIHRQDSPIWERVTILKSHCTRVEQEWKRKNFFFLLLPFSWVSKGKQRLTRMKNIPSFAQNFFANIVFPLRVSWSNYVKLQWETFWKGTDDKVCWTPGHLMFQFFSFLFSLFCS